MKETICAIVLTYNRSELMQRCLRAIEAQSRPVDHILVVDNNSTDDTAEVICTQFRSVELVRLTENSGSAGAAAAGMRRAYLAGYSLFWIMDDDATPTPACLAHLTGAHRHPVEVLAPLVAAEENESVLAFGGRFRQHKLYSIEDAERISEDGLIPGFCQMYNGILVSRSVVDVAGVPDDRLFIWGDEEEYYTRLLFNDVPLATVVDARLRHPANRKTEYLFPWPLSFRMRYTADPVRQYITMRNHAYIHLRYSQWRLTMRHLAKFTLLAICRRDAGMLRRTYVSFYDVLRGNMTRHRVLMGLQ